jgi:Ca-activated chloride channel family protein
LARAKGAPAAPVATVLLALALASSLPPSTSAAEPPGEDAIAKPLTTTVARLAAKDSLSAKDCAELAQTTLTYGQRLQSAQQPPPEPVIRDALHAVSTGEKLDPQAADWPKLRQELEALLQQNQPPPQDKKDDQQKQDQPQNKDQPQQPQDKNQQSQDQQNQDRQQNRDQQPSSDPQQQQQQQNQQAFGDMKDQPPKPQDAKPDTPDPKSPPPKPGTQKVGGQQDKKPGEPADAELAMPLQKLEQVRNQDSPAKLHQLLQGKQEQPKQPAKNW